MAIPSAPGNVNRAPAILQGVSAGLGSAALGGEEDKCVSCGQKASECPEGLECFLVNEPDGSAPFQFPSIVDNYV